LLYFLLLSSIACTKASGPQVSATASPSTTVPTITAGGSIHISGSLSYDFVSAATGHLDYASVTQKPLRNVYVELLNAGDDSVVSSTSTDDLGAYSFYITSSGSIKLRIYAEMKSPAVIIQDNTNGNAEYALVTPAYSITTSTVKDIRALSGWSGTNASGSYSGSRNAAPFAILDSIYSVIKKINAVRPSIVFPLLKANWSVDNIGVVGNKAIGQITTTHYNSVTNQIFILGKADVDTDEFDNHVIVHEWGHFFESNLSRSDSLGGNHSAGDEKNMSLAFSEGWGNALSAMTYDPDYLYSDTFGSKQQSGFQINMETSASDTHKGWYSEFSIQEILYDIYDGSNETGDNITLGIGPIIDVLTGYQKTTTAATSIFSFIHGLELLNSALTADLNILLATKNIAAISDPYGTAETNNGAWAANLPVYNTLNLGGAAVAVSLYGNNGASNFYGLSNTVFNSKYLRFTASSVSTRLNVTASDTFEMDVLKKGLAVATHYEHRTSGAIFGPFVYTITTIPGQEYTVQIYTSQDVIWANGIINLAITGTAL
jgi:hypothetical protein